MITGAHAMIYSKHAEADKAFLRDVLELGHVDVGGGWLIFALPPSEIAVHPGKKSAHEIYFMCEDVNAFKSSLDAKKITTSPVRDQGWGLVTSVTLPGGGELGVYEPRHARPGTASAAASKGAPAASRKRSAAVKPAKGAGATSLAKKRAAQSAPRGKVAAPKAKKPAPTKKTAAGKVKKASRAGR